ncbi:MAG: sensor histidine kinase [Erythrobacter sp.]
MIDTSLYRPLALVSTAVWIGFLLIYVGISLFESGLPADLLQRIAAYTFSAVLSFLAGILVFAALEQMTLPRWPTVFLIAVSTLLMHAAVGVSIYLYFPPYPSLEGAPFLPLFRNGIIYDSPIVSSAFIGFVAIHYGRQLAAQQRLLLEREGAARDAQLATLRHQLSPHFLFNTLNSISALIAEDDPKNAQKAVLMLSDFLRFSLDSNADELVPLEEELGSLQKYLDIEQMRYELRLQVEFDIDDDARDFRVPPFLLQPVIENIVKHAVAKVNRPIHVSLSCVLADGDLSIRVTDDGPGLATSTPQTTGTGLRNLKRRLQLIYGERARMTVTPHKPTGVMVAIWIAYARGRDA